MSKNINEMTDPDYEEWIRNQTGRRGDDEYSEESLVALMSQTLRLSDAGERAQGLVEVANLCIAMADRSLGYQGPVAKCLVLNVH